MEDSMQICSNCKHEISCNNFELHTVYCQRKLKLCDLCNEPVEKASFEKHLDEDHAIDVCHQCDLPFEKWLLPKHTQETCLKRLIPCKFCEAEFPFEEHTEHVNACGSKTEKCLYCRKRVMIKDKEMHLEFHETPQVKYVENNSIIQNIDNGQINISNMHAPDKETVISTDCDLLIKEKEHSDRISLKDRVSMGIDQMKPEENIIPHQPAETICLSDDFEVSSKYTLCHICKKHIPWIDMNLHVPICATNVGKCASCGNDVSGEDIKDHILKFCPKRRGAKHSEKADTKHEVEYPKYNNKVVESVQKLCPFCSNFFSDYYILNHINNCDKNVYTCPYCDDVLPENQRKRHEKFYCNVLSAMHEANHSYDYGLNDRNIADKGAVPKHSNKVHCTNCSNCIPGEEMKFHSENFCRKCKNKKGKSNKMKKSMEKENYSKWDRFKNFCWKGSSGSIEEPISPSWNQSYKDYNSCHALDNYRVSMPLPDSEKIPCEFCDEVLDDSYTFILHMTGSHTDLVSCTKQNTPSIENMKESVPLYQSSFLNAETKVSKQKSTYQKENSSLKKPGEFLQYSSQIGDENKKFPNADENPNLYACWNIDLPFYIENHKIKSENYVSPKNEQELLNDAVNVIENQTLKSHLCYHESLQAVNANHDALQKSKIIKRELEENCDEALNTLENFANPAAQDFKMKMNPTSYFGDLQNNVKNASEIYKNSIPKRRPEESMKTDVLNCQPSDIDFLKEKPVMKYFQNGQSIEEKYYHGDTSEEFGDIDLFNSKSKKQTYRQNIPSLQYDRKRKFRRNKIKNILSLSSKYSLKSERGGSCINEHKTEDDLQFLSESKISEKNKKFDKVNLPEYQHSYKKANKYLNNEKSEEILNEDDTTLFGNNKKNLNAENLCNEIEINSKEYPCKDDSSVENFSYDASSSNLNFGEILIDLYKDLESVKLIANESSFERIKDEKENFDRWNKWRNTNKVDSD